MNMPYRKSDETENAILSFTFSLQHSWREVN